MAPFSFIKAERESRKMAPASLCPWGVLQQAPVPQINALKLGSESLSQKVRVLFKGLLLHLALGQVSLCTGPLRAVPQSTTALWVSWDVPCWSSKSDVLGVYLSGASLESWSAQSGVQTLHLSGRSSRF